MRTTIANPKIQSLFATQGTQLIGSTPQRFAEIVRSDSERWAKVMETAGIKVD